MTVLLKKNADKGAVQTLAEIVIHCPVELYFVSSLKKVTRSPISDTLAI